MRDLLQLARSRTIDHIAELASNGLVTTVSADQPEESVAVCRLALERLPASARIAAIDVGRCDSVRTFVYEFARATVGLYVGDSLWLGFPPEGRPPLARDGLVELGSEVGGTLLRVIDEDDLPADRVTEVFSLAVEAFIRSRAPGHIAVLAMFGADELVPTPKRTSPLSEVTELLWTIRSHLQRSPRAPALLFAGGDVTEELTSEGDSPFFGWGANVRLDPPPALERAIALLFEQHDVDRRRAHTWSREIDRLCEGSVPLAGTLTELTLLEGAATRSRETAPVQAWLSLIEDAATSLRQTVRGLRYLDRLALPVAVALAQGRPPYSVDDFSSGPQRALRRLRYTGFAVQHRPREWRLTDPLLAAWLRQGAVSSRYAFGRPTIYVLRRDTRTFEVTDGPWPTRVRSTHRSVERAEEAARQLAKEAHARVVVVDSEDESDLPRWARFGEDIAGSYEPH